jgi:DNA primase
MARVREPVVVEGPFDAIAVCDRRPGRHAGVAPCGIAFTAQQAAWLSRAADLQVSGVLVAFDPDMAGRGAAVRAYRPLSQVTADTMAAVLPAGQDPARILTDGGPANLATVLASRRHPLADLVIDAELEKWSRWLQLCRWPDQRPARDGADRCRHAAPWTWLTRYPAG